MQQVASFVKRVVKCAKGSFGTGVFSLSADSSVGGAAGRRLRAEVHFQDRFRQAAHQLAAVLSAPVAFLVHENFALPALLALVLFWN